MAKGKELCFFLKKNRLNLDLSVDSPASLRLFFSLVRLDFQGVDI